MEAPGKAAVPVGSNRPFVCNLRESRTQGRRRPVAFVSSASRNALERSWETGTWMLRPSGPTSWPTITIAPPTSRSSSLTWIVVKGRISAVSSPPALTPPSLLSLVKRGGGVPHPAAHGEKKLGGRQGPSPRPPAGSPLWLRRGLLPPRRHLAPRERRHRPRAAVQLRRPRAPLARAAVGLARRTARLPDEAGLPHRRDAPRPLPGGLPPPDGRARPAPQGQPRPLLRRLRLQRPG